MEFKNTKKSNPNSSGPNHFTETNTGHITVKTTSPFLNRRKDSEYTVTDQSHNKSRKNQSASVLNKKLPQDVGSGTSKMLINQIFGDSNIDQEVFMNLNKSYTENNLKQIEKQRNYIQNFLINRVEYKYSTPTFISKSFSMQEGLCSKEDSIVPCKNSTDNEEVKEFHDINNATYSKLTSNKKTYAEKSTYCRPVTNHTQDFLNNTIEKNKTLLKLVKKFIIAKHNEKQTEAWNNYINELKNKHGYGDSHQNQTAGCCVLQEQRPLELIDDYSTTQLSFKQSNECSDLLQNVYEPCNTVQPNSKFYTFPVENNHRSPPSENRSYFNCSSCYPISSQGRLMMLNRERENNAYASDWQERPCSRPFSGNLIHVEDESGSVRQNSNRSPSKKKPAQTNHTFNRLKRSQRKSSSAQTEGRSSFCDCNKSNKESPHSRRTSSNRANNKDTSARIQENNCFCSKDGRILTRPNTSAQTETKDRPNNEDTSARIQENNCFCGKDGRILTRPNTSAQTETKVPGCGVMSYIEKVSTFLKSNPSDDPQNKLPVLTQSKNCRCNESGSAPPRSSSAQTEGIKTVCGGTICVSSVSKSIIANMSNDGPPTRELQKISQQKNCPCIQKPVKIEKNEDEPIKERYSTVSKNVERLKKQIQETGYVERHSLLQSIESKLDTLMKSINSFMDEVKSKTYVKQCFECRSVCVSSTNNKKRNIGVTKSDPFGLVRAEKMVCGLIPEYTQPSVDVNRKGIEKTKGKDIKEILIEEMENSNRVKEDIENILNGNVGNCSVQISIDIPTKEQSTEVTNSMCKALHRLEDKSVTIEEIARNSSKGDRCMTIAVNTDPLGLLALLRISTETVKQLLSYVPNFPYHSYLSLINFPQTSNVHHYVCYLCGAVFMRPSQLSDHIRSHNFSRTRDCCVCRHVIDIQSQRPPSLFRCNHCGQKFTRAYCCELHQESCARRLGRDHDVTPSLMLLR